MILFMVIKKLFILLFVIINDITYCGCCDCCDCCGCCGCNNKNIKGKKSQLINFSFKKDFTIDDLNLDKNIPKNFIDNNKDRVFKMIKVFKNNLNDQDINEILILLYNFDLVPEKSGKICWVLYKKLSVYENSVITIVKNKDSENNIFFYIFHYIDVYDGFLTFFDDHFLLTNPDDECDFNGAWTIEVINKVQKLLTDTFYKINIENGLNFPIGLFFKICLFLFKYFERDGVYKNSNGCKNEIECLLKNNKVEIDLKNKEFNINEPIYIYLNKESEECYEVKDESQFKNLKDCDQIIIKISNQKVEFFKSNQ